MSYDTAIDRALLTEILLSAGDAHRYRLPGDDATDEERRQALRHVADWWNGVALLAIEVLETKNAAQRELVLRGAQELDEVLAGTLPLALRAVRTKLIRALSDECRRSAEVPILSQSTRE